MIENVLRVGVGVGCAFEAFAIFTRKVPTISILVGRYPRAGAVLGGTAIGGLAAHFLLSDEPRR